MFTSIDDLVIRLAQAKGLVGEELIAAARRDLAHTASDEPAPRLVESLQAQGVLRQEDVARLLAEEFGLPVVDLNASGAVPAEVLALVPRAAAVRYHVLPLAREGDILRVAVADPLSTEGIDELTRTLSLTVDVAVAPAAQIARAIERCYGAGPRAIDSTAEPIEPAHRAEKSVVPPGPHGAPADEADADAPIIQLVHTILAEAVRRGASDIHWEPQERRFRVRYRVDGVLYEVDHPPKRLQLAIISRLKLMANISIAEKRLPQDGRFQRVIEGRPLDFRVASLPTTHGESVVMRILDRASVMLGLPELGLWPDDRTTLERLLALSDGLVLVTGPTGSGKTSTLYACLQHLNRPDRKIITVEDPIEYQLTGINQVPVRTEVGVTFATALRAILRQAPNVVMIGEIRDLETAEIAINAALTGHLVFSTLHTNNAAGAVARLVDLGVKPFLVASALRAVVAQRLVRKTCEKCARPYTYTEQERLALGLGVAPPAHANLQRGDGCPACRNTGYHGRSGIFEFLVVDDEIQRMIYAKPGAAQLHAAARAKGLRTLREDGARKTIAGLTTAEEVVSITIGDTS